MAIDCTTCQGSHQTAAEARACWAQAKAWEEASERDEHFCESPSCAVQAGCAAYRYDSAANGYWTTEEESRERAAWAIADARRDGKIGELGPGEIPPPVGSLG